jgi:hypothetical protein
MKISIDKSQIVIIKILQDIFDTSLCKNKYIKFEDYTKYIDIKKIYYIGYLYIDSIDDINQNKSKKIKLFKRNNN